MRVPPVRGLIVLATMFAASASAMTEDIRPESPMLEDRYRRERAAERAGAPVDEDALVPLPASELGWYDDKIHFFEQPDFVLYRLGEQRWDRILHKQLGLSHNTELALGHRERFESVSHLWRRGQQRGTARNPITFTDQQVVSRTRMRLGQRFGDFWGLVEGQHAQLFWHDRQEFDGTSVEDRHDVQQAFVSYTDRSAFGSRFRTDLHVGRITFEYGGTRTIGRNVLPNATNTFDGFHLNVAKGSLWRGRAFYTMPVERDVDDPNESFSKRTFWGLIYENAENPWYLAEAAYLGFNDKVSPLVANRSEFGTYTFRLHRNPPRGVFRAA